MDPFNIDAKLDGVTEHWRPKIVATLNGQEVGETQWRIARAGDHATRVELPVVAPAQGSSE